VDQTNQSKKDEESARRAGQGAMFSEIMNVLARDPLEPTPGHYFERLRGNLKGVYSRRIDYHNRFIYTIHDNLDGAKDKEGCLYDGIVRIHRAWGHLYKLTKRPDDPKTHFPNNQQ